MQVFTLKTAQYTENCIRCMYVYIDMLYVCRVCYEGSAQCFLKLARSSMPYVMLCSIRSTISAHTKCWELTNLSVHTHPLQFAFDMLPTWRPLWKKSTIQGESKMNETSGNVKFNTIYTMHNTCVVIESMDGTLFFWRKQNSNTVRFIYAE